MCPFRNHFNQFLRSRKRGGPIAPQGGEGFNCAFRREVDTIKLGVNLYFGAGPAAPASLPTFVKALAWMIPPFRRMTTTPYPHISSSTMRPTLKSSFMLCATARAILPTMYDRSELSRAIGGVRVGWTPVGCLGRGVAVAIEEQGCAYFQGEGDKGNERRHVERSI